MAVYVDVLLVTNYLVNMLLLSCHTKFAGHRPRRMRLVLAALAGAIGSLSIFLPFMAFFQSILYKLLLSALIVWIAVGAEGLKSFLKDWILFFVVSFLFAGIMLGIWMFLRPAGMLYYNGVVYFDISSVTLLLATVCAYILSGVFWRIARAGRIPADCRRMTVRYGGSVVSMDAFVDSGNRLYEPFSGYPVIVCRPEALRPLFSPELAEAVDRGDFEKASAFGMKLRFVPYNVVGGKGILPAFRADEILLESGGGESRVESAFLALSPAKLPHDALLHPDLTGRGSPGADAPKRSSIAG